MEWKFYEGIGYLLEGRHGNFGRVSQGSSGLWKAYDKLGYTDGVVFRTPTRAQKHAMELL